jgi:peptidoglycan/xylan/chitin deacetylase (PgdA/CDA1 family)
VCPADQRGADSPSLSVTPEQFENQLRLLKILGYRTLSVPDFRAVLQGRKNPPKKPVVLTFDDGYRDNYRYAYPILKKYGFTAEIFLVTERDRNVWDSGTQELLSPGEIEEMHLGGIGFGSHTATHLDLSKAADASAREELKRSREAVSKLTSRTDISFCYPYSRLTPEAKQWVREAGYVCAFSGDSGPEDQASDLFEVMRIQVFPSTSLFGFWKKIQPWYPAWIGWQRKRKQARRAQQ